LPPGAAPQPVEKPAAAPAFESQSPSPIEILIDAPTPTPIEALLPPGAETSPPPAATEVATVKPKRVIEALLPPGAPTGDAAPGERVPIPAAPKPGPLAANLPPGTAAVPTPDGGFVTIKETPRTIGAGDDEIEVRRLSSTEKSARRFRRNLILWGICLAILFVVLVAMMWR
jgi:hypothetical protein